MKRISGYALFFVSLGLFLLQMGYMIFHDSFNVEYSDNRLFFVINMLIVLCLSFALSLLFTFSKRWKVMGVSGVVAFLLLNIIFGIIHHGKIRNVVSVSPDFKHLFVMKEKTQTNEAIYYRTYFGILAQPKERLPYQIGDEYKVEWLVNDVAAFTYNSPDNKIHQYVGTYGDRGGGGSYYYVGPSIHGKWRGENVTVTTTAEGITVQEDGEPQSFDWDHVVQFGTLAIVLVNNNQAQWTIALNENFLIESQETIPPTGEITLYKATMTDRKPMRLEYHDGD